MTEDGPGWHEQAQTMENALLTAQDPAKLVYPRRTAKLTYAGVSVAVGNLLSWHHRLSPKRPAGIIRSPSPATAARWTRCPVRPYLQSGGPRGKSRVSVCP